MNEEMETDEMIHAISCRTEYCPACGRLIGPNIRNTLQSVPDAKYLVCGAYEVQLGIIGINQPK